MHEIVKTVVCKKNYEYIHITYIHIQPCVLCNAAILSIYKIENFTAFSHNKKKNKREQKSKFLSNFFIPNNNFILRKLSRFFSKSSRPVVGYIFIAQNVKLGQN